MKYKFVIADVDGTLIEPNAHHTTSASVEVIKAVEKAREKGVIFSIATARSLDWVSGITDSLKLDAPIILDNGARVYDCMVRKYISEEFISDSDVAKVLSTAGNLSYQMYVVDENGRFAYRPGEKLKFKNVTKMMILHVNPYQSNELYDIFSSFSNLSVTKSISGTNPARESLHITSKKAKKDIALIKITTLLGINPDNVIAIGDSYNDFSMLAVSGLKVAMGNAVEEIKSIADFIAPTYKEDGVAFVLNKFILEDNT